jgi:UDP-N-acetylglucosamine acyltransferase
MRQIHSTAIIHPKAELSDNIVIGPYCQIGEHVVLGENNVLFSHVVIENSTTIGNGNRFYHGCIVGSHPQDLKYKNEPTKLIIGHNNTIREFVTLNISATTDENTIVGDNCLLMAYSHIAHNCRIGSNCIIANAVNLAGHIHIGDFVTIGGMTAIHQFVKIGKYAFLGGKSGVKKDVPPYTRGEGMPYRIIGLNSVGLQRKGFSLEQIHAIKDIYKIFYQSGRNTSQALAEISQWNNLTEEQKIFFDFVQDCERGLNR